MEEWFVLNYVPGPGFRRHTLPELIARFSRHEGAALELFAPTFVALTTERGKVKRVERPLLFHYIFLRGTASAVKRLCQTHEGFSFVIDHAGSRRHLTLPDETVAQYRIIARYYGNNLPYYPLAEVNLEEGDKVEVVDGPLAGLRGTYMSRRGGKSGNILLAVDHQMAAIVYDVKTQYVRVLEFARDSRRAYDQIDAFTLHLLSLLPPRQSADFRADCKANSEATPRAGAPDANDAHDKSSAQFRPAPRPDKAQAPVPLPRAQIQPISAPEDPKSQRTAEPASLAQLQVFTRRLGLVKLHNPKLDAKLQLLLTAAYTLLGDAANAAKARERFAALSHHITNPKTLALVNRLLQDKLINN